MLIALASAKGSPGVTTTAVALGTVWPDEVLVADCDPAGGDLGYRHRDPQGRPLDTERGLLSLATEARRGLAPDALMQQAQQVDGGLRVLLGVDRPEQIQGVGPVWSTIAAAMATAQSADVIVDCGRIVPGTPVQPVLAAAHVVLLCVNPTVESYAHLRDRLRWLLHSAADQPVAPVLGVLLRSPWSDTQAAGDLQKLLAHSGLPVPVVGRIAEDPRAADVLGGRRSRGIARSLLVRSARGVVGPVRELATSARQRVAYP